MMRVRWAMRIFWDIVIMGAVNRSFAMTLALLAFLVIGLTIVAAQISAPFIYTLF
ncbi:MAG: hypothetical protein U0Q11_15865 [Vicinamibacterales bacterium]